MQENKGLSNLNKILLSIYKTNNKIFLNNVFHVGLFFYSEIQMLSLILFSHINMESHSTAFKEPFFHIIQKVSSIFTGLYFISMDDYFFWLSISWIILVNCSWIYNYVAKSSQSNMLHNIITEINEYILCLVAGFGLWGRKDSKVNYYYFFILLEIFLFTLVSIKLSIESFDDKRMISLRHSRYRELNLYFKFLFTCFYKLFSSSTLDWILIILTIFWSMIRMKIVYHHHPFKNYSLAVYTFGFCTLSLTWSLFSILFKLIQDSNLLNFMYIECILGIFIFKIGLLILSKHYFSIFQQGYTRIKTPNDAFGYLLSTTHYQSNSIIQVGINDKFIKNDETLIFLGTSAHSEHKSIVNIEENAKTKSKIENCMIEDALNFSIKKFPKNVELYFYYAHFMLQNKISYRSFLFLTQFPVKKLNFRQSKLYMELKEMVESNYQGTEIGLQGNDILVMKDYILHNTLTRNLMNKMKNLCFHCLEFWKIFLREVIDLKQILNYSNFIDEKSQEIDKAWDVFVEIFPSHLDWIVTYYSLFLTVVRNMPYRAQIIKISLKKKQKTHKQLSKFREETRMDKLFDPNNIIFTASVAKGSEGVIRSASESVYGNLGWSQEEMVGKNVSSLMNESLAKAHGRLVQDYVNSGNDLEKNISVFCKKKNGYFYHFNLELRMYPYVTSGLEVFCILEPKDTNDLVIIVGKKGIIEGFNEKADQFFDITYSEEKKMEVILSKSEFKIFEGENEQEAPGYLTQTFLNVDDYSEEISNYNLLRVKKKVVFLRKMSEKIVKFTAELQKRKFKKEYYYIFKVTDMKYETLDDYYTAIYETENQDIPIEKEKDIRMRRLYLKASCISDSSRGKFHFDDKGSPKHSQLVKKISQIRYLNVAFGRKRIISNFENLQSQRSSITIKYQKKRKFTEVPRLSTKLDVASITSTESVHAYKKTIESLIHTFQIGKSLKILYFIGILFILIVAILFIYFQLNSIHRLEICKNEIDIVLACVKTQREFTWLSRMVLAYYLIGKGLWTDNRYEKWGVPILRKTRQTQLPVKAALVDTTKNFVRSKFYQLEDNFVKKIIELKVEVKDKDNIISSRSIHPFDLLTKMHDSALRIAAIPYQNVTDQDPNIKFFVNNSFDGLLLSLEDIMEQLRDDIFLELETIVETATTIMAVTLSSGIVVLICLSFQISNTIKYRNDLANLLTILEDSKIEHYIKEIELFVKSVSNPEVHVNFDIKTKAKEQDPTIAKKILKRISRIGINRSIWKTLAFTLVFISLTVIIFGVLIKVSDEKRATLIDDIQNEKQVNHVLYYVDLLMNSVYLNLADGPSKTIKNVPVSETIEDYYTKFSSLTPYILLMTAKYDNPIITNFATTDLCQVEGIRSQTPFNESYCYDLGNGAMRRGLVGIIDSTASAFKSAYDDYKVTNRTHADKINLFANKFLKDAETVIAFMVLLPFSTIQSEIHTMTLNRLDDYIHLLQAVLLPLVIFIAIYGFICWTKIWSMLKNEKIGWRKLCRLIPYNITASNKILQSFMKRKL